MAVTDHRPVGLLSVPGKDLAHQHPVVVVPRQYVAAIEPFLEQPVGRLIGLTSFVVSEVSGDDNAIEFESRSATRFEHLDERISRGNLPQHRVGFGEEVQV